MKTKFATRFAATCASVGTTFITLWAVVLLAGPSAQAPTQVARALNAAPTVVAISPSVRQRTDPMGLRA